uniref:Acyl-coenzyme A thioesterase 13 n=1 Tax=Cacopsylla melanoneura TaxID=428564 RepID=A0A8D8PQV7_9HEMI
MDLKGVTGILQKMIDHEGHDTILKKVKIVEANDKGTCIAELTVEKEHTNIFNTLHGGYIATLVDIITSLAILAHPRVGKGVSVNLNVSYLKPAKLGDELVIEGTTSKAGRTLAYLDCKIYIKSTKEIVATASHCKFIRED